MVKRKDIMDIPDVLELLGIPLLGVIPEDEAVIASTNRGEPAVLAPTIGDMGATGSAGGMLQGMPGSQAALAGYDEAQGFVVYVLVFMLAPFYLILPVVSSMSIACDSFAGEKERKTLEALLYTPTSDRELLVAKILSAMVPAVAIAWIGFLLYSITANLAAWSTMGRIFFPNLMWVFLALWVAPAVAGLGLGVTVLVSARAQTFQEAYQVGGVIVLPILLLVVGQATGILYFSPWLVLVLGLVFWIVDAVLLYLGARRFRRSELAAGM